MLEENLGANLLTSVAQNLLRYDTKNKSDKKIQVDLVPSKWKCFVTEDTIKKMNDSHRMGKNI